MGNAESLMYCSSIPPSHPAVSTPCEEPSANPSPDSFESSLPPTRSDDSSLERLRGKRHPLCLLSSTRRINRGLFPAAYVSRWRSRRTMKHPFGETGPWLRNCRIQLGVSALSTPLQESNWCRRALFPGPA
jgi:hypothetical protein